MRLSGRVVGREGRAACRDKATGPPVAFRKNQSHIIWSEPDHCRSVAYNPVLVSRNLGSPGATVSPNVVQKRPMKSGQPVDDCRPLHLLCQLRPAAFMWTAPRVNCQLKPAPRYAVTSGLRCG